MNNNNGNGGSEMPSPEAASVEIVSVIKHLLPGILRELSTLTYPSESLIVAGKQSHLTLEKNPNKYPALYQLIQEISKLQLEQPATPNIPLWGDAVHELLAAGDISNDLKHTINDGLAGDQDDNSFALQVMEHVVLKSIADQSEKEDIQSQLVEKKIEIQKVQEAIKGGALLLQLVLITMARAQKRGSDDGRNTLFDELKNTLATVSGYPNTLSEKVLNYLFMKLTGTYNQPGGQSSSGLELQFTDATRDWEGIAVGASMSETHPVAVFMKNLGKTIGNGPDKVVDQAVLQSQLWECLHQSWKKIPTPSHRDIPPLTTRLKGLLRYSFLTNSLLSKDDIANGLRTDIDERIKIITSFEPNLDPLSLFEKSDSELREMQENTLRVIEALGGKPIEPTAPIYLQ